MNLGKRIEVVECLLWVLYLWTLSLGDLTYSHHLPSREARETPIAIEFVFNETISVAGPKKFRSISFPQHICRLPSSLLC